jgi:DNA-directed RNA polymerase beta' subunit
VEKVYNPEFSRIVEINEHVLNKKFEILANEEELRKLADRFGLYCIKNLSLKYIITNKTNISKTYILAAEMKSSITKFIMEDSEENIEINEKFDVLLLTKEIQKENEDQLKEFDIEILSDCNSVDIGEIASQYLSLFVFM